MGTLHGDGESSLALLEERKGKGHEDGKAEYNNVGLKGKRVFVLQTASGHRLYDAVSVA